MQIHSRRTRSARANQHRRGEKNSRPDRVAGGSRAVQFAGSSVCRAHGEDCEGVGSEFLVGVVDWQREPQASAQENIRRAVRTGRINGPPTTARCCSIRLAGACLRTTKFISCRSANTCRCAIGSRLPDGLPPTFPISCRLRITRGPRRSARSAPSFATRPFSPDEIRRFAANGAQLLINISNDGWFGRSAAPAQHLMMSRVRAIENRRWLLRDTNNGFTVVVDPYGRIVARMPTDIRGELEAPYDFRSRHNALRALWRLAAAGSASRSIGILAWRCGRDRRFDSTASAARCLPRIHAYAIAFSLVYSLRHESIVHRVARLIFSIFHFPVYSTPMAEHIEDIQHRYTDLKKRIELVRSYL